MDIEKAQKIQEQYKQCLNWKKQKGFIDKWATYERFKAGDQWPPSTPKTKHFPRPVFNLIEYIENHKTASIMTEMIKLLYSPEETGIQGENLPSDINGGAITTAQQGADLFTKYAETTWENIKQDELNDEALEDCSNVGTCIWHYYWDNSINGGTQLQYIGDMQGETIDPMNYFPGNPNQPKVQKQPYIIVTGRDLIENIKELAKNNGVNTADIDLIKPDSDTQDDYDSAKVENKDNEKATVITKYWKEKGHVYFMKVCGNIIVQDKTDTGFNIYPIAIMFWRKRKKCAFGVGDTEGLIANQKAVNLLMAMQLMIVQQNGLPKLMIKPEWITQQITNEIGEVIKDNNPNQGAWSAQYLQGSAMNPLTQSIIDAFIQYTKTLSGTTETSTGDVTKAGQFNAQAIMLLQQASGIPLDKIKKRYHQAMEDVGRIWEQFWKVKYNTLRVISIKDENNKQTSALFRGTDYSDVNMNLKIDVSTKAAFSEVLAQQTLDKMYDKGDIDKILYLKYSTDASAPFKESLMRDLQNQQDALAEQQIQQQQGVLQQGQDSQNIPQQENIQQPQNLNNQAGIM